MFKLPGVAQAAILEEEQAQWRAAICNARPMDNVEHVRFLCAQLTERAMAIGRTSPMDPRKILTFFFTVSKAWLLSGSTYAEVLAKLPKNTEELGYLVISENINPHTGEPLSDRDLRRASRLGKVKLQ